MDIKAFLAENVGEKRQETFPLSDRFLHDGKPASVCVRGISEGENEAIRQSAYYQKKDGTTGIQRDLYYKRLVAASTVEPDLKSDALWKSWGVYSAEALIDRMFTAGEYAALLSKVLWVNGFSESDEALKKEIKKGFAGETAN